MFGDLRKVSDTELSDLARMILARGRVLTSFDCTELYQIGAEFRRRDLLAGVLTKPDPTK